MIYTNTTHSFGIDRTPSDPMSSYHMLARGNCRPKAEWFFITLGGNKEDTRLTWEEWDQIVEKVKELRAASQMEVILSAKGTPVKEGE